MEKNRLNIIWIFYVFADANSHITTWREMYEQMKDHHDIHFIFPYKNSKECFTSDASLVKVSGNFLINRILFLVKAFFVFRKIYNKSKPDIVILGNWSFFFSFIRVFSSHKAKFIYDSRTPIFGQMTGKNKWKSNVFKSYSKLVLKYNSKFHDGLTCISDALRDIYEKTFGFKLNENYHSWPSGVNLSQFVSERKLSSKEESNHINMIFHGSITSTRGLQNAVHGLNEYRKFNSEFTFYIYGGGSFQDKLAGIVNELDLNDHVKFMGTVPPEDIPGIIDTMDLAIMTYPKTMYWEGNVPLKILEYIAMKIPVICSRLNVFEQITDGYDRCIFVDEIDPVSICNGLKEFEKKKVKFLSTDINVDPIIEKYTWENIARDFERYLYKMTAS